MSIATAIRKVLAPSAPEPLTLDGQRAELFDRRAKVVAKLTNVTGRIQDGARELRALATVAQAYGDAQAALAAGEIAVDQGETPAEPVDVLQSRLESARQADADAQRRAITVNAVQAARQAEIPGLQDAIKAIDRDISDLVLPGIDARIVARNARRAAAIAELRAVVHLDRVDVYAFNTYARHTARGEVRWSAAPEDEAHNYAMLVHIPVPKHPSIRAQPTDRFEAGQLLVSEHAAFDAEEQAVAREVPDLLNRLLIGG